MKNYKTKLYSKRKYLRKMVKNKKYYLIKWEGYSLKSCSWEPLSHLDKILDLVEEFDNNFPDSIEKEDYQQFLKLYKRFKVQKMINKMKNIKKKDDKTPRANKFIINLDDLNNNQMTDTKFEINNKADTSDNLNENNIKLNGDENVMTNISNDRNNNNYNNMKLIRPIMVW